jgi:hypothetical protein
MSANGFYRASVNDFRAESTKRLNEAQRAYNRLRDKSTRYAREIAELLALNARVEEVWRTAPDDILPNPGLDGQRTKGNDNDDADIAVPSKALVAAAQLLDDCLIRIYPEEFAPEHRESAAQRFSAGCGTIGRIATMSDKLREAANSSNAAQKAQGRGRDENKA